MAGEIETPERENVRLKEENARLREELASRNVPWIQGQAVDHRACHRLGAELFARADAAETRVRELSAALVEARHTLEGLCDATLDDWQKLVDRAEKAEARLKFMETVVSVPDDPDLFVCNSHDKAVCDAMKAVEEDELTSGLEFPDGISLRVCKVYRAELDRRKAREAAGICGACAEGRPDDCSGWCRNYTTGKI